ncbi:MAG: SMC family ATPase [Clostridia bacterium]|nr:SMC family ATPase [Clostridia bacterium]
MRPIKLTMSAFGAYADKTEINFEKLGQSGIYLITGNTGAGKTTIFDAIVYALYGETSNSDRKPNMFRSVYANGTTKTYVELWFQCNGKEYRVRRNPEYDRPKDRGEGTTKEKSSCELEKFADKTIVSKSTKEVNNAIQEIIGLDCNQFMQIAMIAQGEFKKLLTSSTDERKKIFSKIFKTGKYGELQKKLKENWLSADSKRKVIRQSINQYIEGIVCEKDSIYYIDVEQLKQGDTLAQESIELLEKMNDSDSQQLKESDDQLQEIDEQLKKVSIDLEKITAYNKARKQSEKVRSDIEQRSQVLTVRKRAMDNAENSHKSISTHNNGEIGKIRTELPRYDTIFTLGREIDNLTRQIQLKDGEYRKNTDTISKMEKEIEKLHEERTFLEGSSENTVRYRAEKEKVEKEKSSLEKVGQSVKEYQEKKSKFTKKQKSCEQAIQQFEVKAKRYQEMYSAFLREQAGILAEKLQDNEPCPVCGSLHHPKLAEKSQIAPTEQELEIAQKQSETARKEADKLKSECQQQKGAVEQARQTLTVQLSECGIEGNFAEISQILAEKIAVCQNEIQKISAKIRQEENNIKRRQQIEKLIPQQEKVLQELRESIGTIENQKTVFSTQKAEKEKQRNELQSGLQFGSKNEAEKKIDELEQEIVVSESSYRRAKKEYDKQSETIATLKGEQKKLEEQIADNPNLDEDQLRRAERALNEQKATVNRRRGNLHSNLNANRRTLENIRQQCNDYVRLEKECRLVKTLSDTASGSVGNGKDKIELETFVQMTYFDRILERANIRFRMMTDGQYEMERRKKAENKRSQTGLDIDVIDYHNGEAVRSISTLSGGESFKASLSLALGLADEVQSSAGGVRLDTMFVDEGFGTLDDESLNNAIKALYDLSEGNRLVGIISHVKELENRIDKKIVITKDVVGSHAKVIEE